VSSAQGEMKFVGSSVTRMLPVPAGQLIQISTASEQQMIKRPSSISLIRAVRVIVNQVAGLAVLTENQTRKQQRIRIECL